jgi:Ca2+-binding RTX toxin-like protein
MSGGEGNDTIDAGLGADIVNGDAGADRIWMVWDQGAADVVNGGAGFDTVDFNGAYNMSTYVDLERQFANDGAALKDSFKNVEHFHGTGYDDVLLGDDASNWFQGGLGDDVLQGRDGADWLDGGWGADLLTGGQGADVFVLYAGDDFLGTDWPSDVITDFVRGTDKLELSLYSFGFDTEADFKIVNAADPLPADGLSTLLFETDTHRLWWDEDGTGDEHDPYLIATLDGITQLAVSDFEFVA